MSDDLIRRSDAIKALHEKWDGGWLEITGEWIADNCEAVLNRLPSADRPQGEWIDKGRNLWGCSNCGMEIYSESERDRNEFHKWCSRCGARMKGKTMIDKEFIAVFHYDDGGSNRCGTEPYRYAEEIVRCRECKWRKACKVFSPQQITNDSFCSWGERKDDE